jgi:hypothetical protein
MTLFLGKKPAVPNPHDFAFAAYREPRAAIVVPRTFGHYQLVPNFGMLGNDRAGDCVWAGADHETMIWLATHGVGVQFTDAAALSDYSAVTGYNAADPNSDQGTDVHEALSYRRHVGVVDSAGVRHKLGAFVELEPGNYEHLIEATYLFGAVGIGFEFPESAMAQFDAGKPWSVVTGSKIDGGHYVPVVGRAGSYIDVVTWGKVQRMTRTFYERYCDEAYALLSPEYLHRGRSPEGFDLKALTADLASLKK